jgi:dephospho-CoA kinase
MKKIGLTGGIGSGKSTIAEIFKILNVPVYNSDERAKALMNENPQLIKEIKKIFGNDIYQNGELNRAELGAIVFKNSELLNQLNAIVHPAVGRDFNAWSAAQNAKYVIKEAAIIFETGIEKSLDGVIAVIAPNELRIKRVLKRPGMTEALIKERINNQLPSEVLENRANWIIKNDESELVIQQVLKIHSEILSLSNT